MKRRVDQWLVQSSHFSSREKARRAVMAGQVMLGTALVDKPSRMLTAEEAGQLRVNKRDSAVSRAYYKLDRALEVFPLAVADRVCMDVGASTGGFTQRLLEAGARRVFAVDCGTNQLDFRIRRDPRVTSMEKTNARYLVAGMFDEPPGLAVMDVSFISVSKIIPVLGQELRIPELVVLIKPQFEAGRGLVGKGGIVRDQEIWREVITRILAEAALFDYSVSGLEVSPLKGGQGNVEFLAYLRQTASPLPPEPDLIDAVIRRAVEVGRDAHSG